MTRRVKRRPYRYSCIRSYFWVRNHEWSTALIKPPTPKSVRNRFALPTIVGPWTCLEGIETYGKTFGLPQQQEASRG